MNICGIMLRPRDVCVIEQRQEKGWWMRLERKEQGGSTTVLLQCPVTYSAWKELETYMVPNPDLVMEKVFVAPGRFIFMAVRKS